MLSIKVIAVGSLKEKFWKDACAEFQKRLGRFCNLQIIEIAESGLPTPKQALEAEAKQILSKCSGFVIALAIAGKKLSSEEFSAQIEKLMVQGESEICFVIGSSHGLDASVTNKANMLLSFSDMTFPHQLMRVILLEQIYRAFQILANTPYHK